MVRCNVCGYNTSTLVIELPVVQTIKSFQDICGPIDIQLICQMKYPTECCYVLEH